MKKILLVVVAMVTMMAMVVGCVNRIPVYSPRQTDTQAHREARAPQDCLDCHDLSQRPSHAPSDDCLQCHKITKGN
ncbi:MAG: hypothetical protein C0624_03520 [Desulfuromonas sp.]|nr:MAG: hypothetical protein C0624_03520 [Desulfuromonas sp.]